MGWEDIAVNLGVSAAKKFYEYVTQKKDGIKKEDVISIGLSVGYFYNFLDPVSDKINSGDFQIFSSIDDKDPKTYNADNIKMAIIVPKRLDVYSFKACEDDFKKYKKGNIYLNRQNRWYGINYGVTETAVGDELVIVDLARPVMAVKPYYEQIVKVNTDAGNEKWLGIQLTEIAAFKESLKKLQELGYGVLVNKVDFRELG